MPSGRGAPGASARAPAVPRQEPLARVIMRQYHESYAADTCTRAASGSGHRFLVISGRWPGDWRALRSFTLHETFEFTKKLNWFTRMCDSDMHPRSSRAARAASRQPRVALRLARSDSTQCGPGSCSTQTGHHPVGPGSPAAARGCDGGGRTRTRGGPKGFHALEDLTHARDCAQEHGRCHQNQGGSPSMGGERAAATAGGWRHHLAPWGCWQCGASSEAGD